MDRSEGYAVHRDLHSPFVALGFLLAPVGGARVAAAAVPAVWTGVAVDPAGARGYVLGPDGTHHVLLQNVEQNGTLYVAEPLFRRSDGLASVVDLRVRSGRDFPRSHSAYWEVPAVWEAIATAFGWTRTEPLTVRQARRLGFEARKAPVREMLQVPASR